MTTIFEKPEKAANAETEHSTSEKKPHFNFADNQKDFKIGTFKGVFLPSLLQMIGVIMFMRLGWILGHVGMLKMFFIITMSSSLLFLTSLSMTSIVSNMKMGTGGSYYIISRMLGVSLGSAIGILLFIGQHASIALCVSGFVLSLKSILPSVSPDLLKIITIFSLALISYLSTNLALKTQILIFIALMISLASIFLGSGSNIPADIKPLDIAPALSFWLAFAMFFPATTGIDSGMAMSGDLKKPSRSLPIGTLGAVLFAYFLYLSIALFLSGNVSAPMLRSHPFIIFHLSKISSLVTLGVWGATLSSALGSMLSAPRTMQSIAKDGTLPKFLAQGHGPSNQPRTATLFVFAASLVLTLFTNIDQIIPIMTMISLVTYGLINFVAFFEEFIQNPSWRPSFRIHWALSLIGALGCFMAMFMINPGATFSVTFLTIALFIWTSKRRVKGNFDDIRYSLFSYLVHRGTTVLSGLKKNARSWRPHILTIFDPALIEKNLVFFSHSLNQEKGFLTFGFCPTQESAQTYKELRISFQKNIEQYKVPSYIQVNPAAQFLTGALQLIRNYGFGPLKPNTIILPLASKHYQKALFGEMLVETLQHGKNIILLKEGTVLPSIEKNKTKKHSQINLWWRGQYRGNFELCLALAHIMQNCKTWHKARICIKTIVKSEEEQSKISHFFDKYAKKLRMKDLSFTPIIEPSEKFMPTLLSSSEDADLTFIGLRKPKENETPREYQEYYLNLFENTKEMKNIAFVVSGERIKFEKIFS